ncbi:MAG: hypothetical protein RQM92_03350 [Candidatus Syntrophopropionicum ammoniitolerans]
MCTRDGNPRLKDFLPAPILVALEFQCRTDSRRPAGFARYSNLVESCRLKE